ncbi:N,N'-diacetylchitobiose transport system permease protein [Actinoplanes campanulatus]|uniref:N,N'-diacetylchitobiose transport system permease protein n=1 Tax=Actinoplanes campanulatus TaxID=113559 RepID=A0A7W5ASC2_9ACTN|nr:carbohydrate ABC transporter permease [Actinoplanes campanulatus]MBB3101400.1 N,N'-diacetylchitobiose transport system permease protein [Actinoplanes campanulatus]GGN49562.1 sugar ABC transporter permease [Actinoplanes campanulatus]GID42242.1 sugar ABC transporter permease [Actinoplanes campanulatus]
MKNAVAAVFCLVWLFPVYWMVNTALKPRPEVMTPTPHFWPHEPTLNNFTAAVTQPQFLTDLRNSVVVVAATVLASIVLGIFAAAALSRFRFRGRRAIMVVILAVQMLPATAMLIPLFTMFNSLDLLGTYLALILAYVATVLPFSIWVMRGFFVAIPAEVEEAAQIDGAGTWRILVSVLFPLVAPGVIATGIFAFIAAWNDYLIAYTFMQDESRYTLPVWLASFTNPHTGTDFGAQMAASVLFSVPVIVFFLLIQRNLVAGMSAGAVKG